MYDVLTSNNFEAASETEVNAARGSSLCRLENYEFILQQIRRAEIRLEPLRPDHAAALHANATPEILRRARVPVVSSREEASDWIYQHLADPCKYGFAITQREYGFVGVISVTVVEGAGWFFFWLGETYWGQGYALAAAAKLMQFIFDGLSLERIFTCAFHDNQPSIRILGKLGLRRIKISDPDLCYYHCSMDEPSDWAIQHHLQRIFRTVNYQ